MQLKIIEKFAAAHHLENYVGPCATKHGHTWRVEVLLDVTKPFQFSENGNGTHGLSVDFGRVKSVIRGLLPDHKDLNEVLPFNPTAENLAKWLGDKIQSQLYYEMPLVECPVQSVIVWESDTAAAIATRGTDF